MPATPPLPYPSRGGETPKPDPGTSATLQVAPGNRGTQQYELKYDKLVIAVGAYNRSMSPGLSAASGTS